MNCMGGPFTWFNGRPQLLNLAEMDLLTNGIGNQTMGMFGRYGWDLTEGLTGQMPLSPGCRTSK